MAVNAVIAVTEPDWVVEKRNAGPEYGYSEASAVEHYAPFPVFFEGHASAPGTREAKYEWDFDDGNTQSGGINAAHVYESPGVYTAKLTVTANGQESSDTIQITVLERTGDTYYVDSEIGDDDNDGLGQGADHAWKTALKAFNTLWAKTLSCGDRILFKRGQTFTVGSRQVTVSHWPGNGFLIGAYGTGAKPIIKLSGTSDPAQEYSMILANTAAGTAHFTFQDLVLDGTSADQETNVGTFWYSTASLFDLLFLRCDFQNNWNDISVQEPTDVNRIHGLFMKDCSFYRSAYSMVFGTATRWAILENEFDLSGNHIAYLSVMNNGVIRGNSFSRSAFGRCALRLCARTKGGVTPKNIYVDGNAMSGWIDPVTNNPEEKTNSIVGMPPEEFEGYFDPGPSDAAKKWGEAHNGGGTRYNFSLFGVGTGSESLTDNIECVEISNNTISDAEVMCEIHVCADVYFHGNKWNTVDTSGRPRIMVYDDSVCKGGPINGLVFEKEEFSHTGAPATENKSAYYAVENYTGLPVNGLSAHQGIVWDHITTTSLDDTHYNLLLNEDTTGLSSNGNKFLVDDKTRKFWKVQDQEYAFDEWKAAYNQDAASTMLLVGGEGERLLDIVGILTRGMAATPQGTGDTYRLVIDVKAYTVDGEGDN